MSITEKFNELKRKNKIDKSSVLLNGLTITCIVLSLSSGIVDIVCYSGLSKSYFYLGTFKIAAAILYTTISIGLTSGKFWCAMKIGMLKELKNRLKSQKLSWYKNINRALLPWQVVHKILIGISLLTAFSMSVNSIGTGIRAMQQNIDRLSTDVATLIELRASVDEGTKDKSSAAKANITGKLSAKDSATAAADRYWPNIDEWQARLKELYKTYPITEEFTKEEQAALIETERAPYKKMAPTFVGNNIDYISYDELIAGYKKITSENENIDASLIYEEAVAYDKGRIEETLNAIIEKEYRLPNGELISFTNSDGDLVNVSTAIARLQTAISEWQNDTGDVGESAKMFTLIATYIKADEKAGGMGVSEIMLLIFIFITGVVQEVLISICTPSATISRSTLSSVSRYCEWKNNAEKEKFLISVYQDYVGDGVIGQEEFEQKCKKSVELMERTPAITIEKYSTKKSENPLQKRIDELESQLKEEREKEPIIKEIIKEVPVEVPVEVVREVIKEVPVEKKTRKIVKENLSENVDKAAAELDDLIKDIEY